MGGSTTLSGFEGFGVFGLKIELTDTSGFPNTCSIASDPTTFSLDPKHEPHEPQPQSCPTN